MKVRSLCAPEIATEEFLLCSKGFGQRNASLYTKEGKLLSKEANIYLGLREEIGHSARGTGYVVLIETALKELWNLPMRFHKVTAVNKWVERSKSMRGGTKRPPNVAIEANPRHNGAQKMVWMTIPLDICQKKSEARSRLYSHGSFMCYKH